MSSKVRLPLPLVRQNPWFPGQTGGVPGADNDTGLRSNPTGVVFYVDPNYPGATDSRDGTNPTDPLRTVQAAVDKCRPYMGDVIIVGASDGYAFAKPDAAYAASIMESVVIETPGIRLIGDFQSSGQGVPWYVPADGVGIMINANEVLIEGFAFYGAAGGAVGETAIAVEWDGLLTFGDAVVVRNCYFDNTLLNGITLEYVWHADIHDCYFDECGEYGIYVDPLGSGIRYCHIRSNRFHNCGVSNLYLPGADDCLIAGNHVYSANAQGALAALDELITTEGGDSNMVVDNYLSCLLPVPANGDYNNACTGAATDAWINNHLMNGVAVTIPT